MPLHKLIVAGLIMAGMSVAQAADLGSGTITVAAPSLDFGSGPNTGVNPTVDAGMLTCINPVLACDTFALTVDLPEDLVEYFPGAIVRLFMDWESASGADDYDLYLFDAGGNEIDSSISSGGPESITFLADPGVNDYRVDVAFYLVAGASYNTNITLDLGEPAAEKSEAEVAAWLAEHGGAQSRQGETLPSCQAPGVTILADAGGDTAFGMSNSDLEELRVYQTLDADGEPLIGFELKVADLNTLTPQSTYFVSFNTFYGDVRGVRMEVDLAGEVTLFSYVVSEDTDGDREGHFVQDGTAVPAHDMSGYTADGLISIFVRPDVLQLFEPGDVLSGFNAASTLFVGAAGVGGSSTTDSMPDGLSRQGEFEYLAQQDCVAERSAPARASGLSPRGGSAGWWLLALAGLALVRRVRR